MLARRPSAAQILLEDTQLCVHICMWHWKHLVHVALETCRACVCSVPTYTGWACNGIAMYTGSGLGLSLRYWNQTGNRNLTLPSEWVLQPLSATSFSSTNAMCAVCCGPLYVVGLCTLWASTRAMHSFTRAGSTMSRVRLAVAVASAQAGSRHLAYN